MPLKIKLNRPTVLAIAAGFALLLSGCGTSAPPGMPSTTSQGVMTEVELIDPTEVPIVQTLNSLAVNPSQVSRIEVVPRNIILSSAATPKFYVNAFDSAGSFLGKVNYADLIFTQPSGQTLAIARNTITSFKVTVPAEFNSKIIEIGLKGKAGVSSAAVIDVITTKTDVTVLSDTVVKFPIPGSDGTNLTQAQLDAAIRPFSRNDVATALNARSTEFGIIPLIINTSKAPKVGQKIFIPNTMSVQGIVKSVKSSGSYHLITIRIAPLNDVFVNYDLKAPQQSFDSPVNGAPNLTAQGSASNTFSTHSLINLSPSECPINAGVGVPTPQIAVSAGGSISQNSDRELIATLKAGVDVKYTGTSAIGFNCSAKITLPSVPVGLLSADVGLKTDITGNINVQATVFSFSASNDKSFNISKGIKDLGGTPKLSASMNKDGGEYLNMPPLIGTMNLEQFLGFEFTLHPGPVGLNKFFAAAGKFLNKELEEPITIVALVGPKGGYTLEVPNLGAAWQQKKDSSLQGKISLKASVETSGLIGDYLASIGTPFLILPEVTIELATFGSRNPAIKDHTVTNKPDNADLTFNWDEPAKWIILGSNDEPTVHNTGMLASGGNVRFNPEKCSPIRAYPVSAGPLYFDTVFGKFHLFDDLPFYADTEVLLCATPKIVADVPALESVVGSTASETMKVSNVGQAGSILNFKIVPAIQGELNISPDTGQVKQGDAAADITISKYCSSEGTTTHNLLINDTINKSTEPFKSTVTVVCRKIAPKISDIPDLSISANVRTEAKGNFIVSNIGDFNSTLIYSISASDLLITPTFDEITKQIFTSNSKSVNITKMCNSTADSGTYPITITSNDPDAPNKMVKLTVKCLPAISSPTTFSRVARGAGGGRSEFCYYQDGVAYGRYGQYWDGRIDDSIPDSPIIEIPKIIDFIEPCSTNSSSSSIRGKAEYKAWVAKQFEEAVARFKAYQDFLDFTKYEFYIDCGGNGYYPVDSDYCYNYLDWAYFKIKPKL